MSYYFFHTDYQSVQSYIFLSNISIFLLHFQFTVLFPRRASLAVVISMALQHPIIENQY